VVTVEADKGAEVLEAPSATPLMTSLEGTATGSAGNLLTQSECSPICHSVFLVPLDWLVVHVSDLIWLHDARCCEVERDGNATGEGSSRLYLVKLLLIRDKFELARPVSPFLSCCISICVRSDFSSECAPYLH
jgi:hypothetical protein